MSIAENPSKGSWGEYQLLKTYFRDLEKQELEDHMNAFGRPLPSKPRFAKLAFNTRFLNFTLQIHKELHCEYCGKPNLKIIPSNRFYKGANKVMATTDHFYPSSLYPQFTFEERNCLVSCESCNKKKGSRVYTQEQVRFPYPGHTPWELIKF